MKPLEKLLRKIVSKRHVDIHELNIQYAKRMNRPIPFSDLGFRDLQSFLKTLPSLQLTTHCGFVFVHIRRQSLSPGVLDQQAFQCLTRRIRKENLVHCHDGCICTECQKFVVAPVVLNCAHVICGSCAAVYSTTTGANCGSCGYPVHRTFPTAEAAIKNEIHGLVATAVRSFNLNQRLVRCLAANLGCDWIGCVVALQKHWGVCPYNQDLAGTVYLNSDEDSCNESEMGLTSYAESVVRWRRVFEDFMRTMFWLEHNGTGMPVLPLRVVLSGIRVVHAFYPSIRRRRYTIQGGSEESLLLRTISSDSNRSGYWGMEKEVELGNPSSSPMGAIAVDKDEYVDLLAHPFNRVFGFCLIRLRIEVQGWIPTVCIKPASATRGKFIQALYKLRWNDV